MFHIERRGDVTIFRMDDGKVNAMSPAFLEQFPKAWAGVGDSAVVLCGNAKALSAGLDLKAVATLDPRDMPSFTRAFMRSFRDVLAHPRPVVSAVEGAALAGGAVFALCSDFRLVAPTARMGVTEVPVGVPFPWPVAELARLRLPAHEHAAAILQGVVRQGADLVARGWADRVVEKDHLLDGAVALASELSASSPLAYAMAKRDLTAPLLASFDRFEKEGIEPWVATFAHADTRAALARTLEKLGKR